VSHPGWQRSVSFGQFLSRKMNGAGNAAASDRRIAIPHTRDGRTAIGTVTVDQMIRDHAKSKTADDDAIARRAMRAFEVTHRSRNVARINEPQSGTLADLISAKKLARRRIGVAGPFVILMKRSDVPRDVD